MNTITRQDGLAAIGAWWAARENMHDIKPADHDWIIHPLSAWPGVTAGQFRAAFAPWPDAIADEMFTVDGLRQQVADLTEQLAERRLEVDTLTAASADLQRRCDTAHTQRNTLAVAFATMALRTGWKAGWGRDNDEHKGYDEVWRTVVYIDLPSGQQLSWHMNPDVQPWAQMNLPKYDGQWDGTFIGRDAPEWMNLVVGLPCATPIAEHWQHQAKHIVSGKLSDAKAGNMAVTLLRVLLATAHMKSAFDAALPPADPFSDDMLRTAAAAGVPVPGERFTVKYDSFEAAAVTQAGTEYLATLAPLLDRHFDVSEGGPAKCDNEDQWNCKYCGKTADCAALKDKRNFGKPMDQMSIRPGVRIDEIRNETMAHIRRENAAGRDVKIMHGDQELITMYADPAKQREAMWKPMPAVDMLVPAQTGTTLAPLLDKHFDVSEGGPREAVDTEVDTAFADAMGSRNYGQEEADDARFWFSSGWDARFSRMAHEIEARVAQGIERPVAIARADEADKAMAAYEQLKSEHGHQQRHIDQLKAKLAGTETLLDQMTKERDEIRAKANAWSIRAEKAEAVLANARKDDSV